VSRVLRVDNLSENHQADAQAHLQAIDHAISLQMRDVAKAWGEYVWRVLYSAGMSGWHIALLDTADQADALGYHALTPNGEPYARVFLDPVLNHGGMWTAGALSISAVISHEAIEMVLDPGANRWADDWHGTAWALEGCDCTENDSYTIGDVAVSNFVWPDYFNPLGQGPYDQMGLITKPFEIRPDGYAVKWDTTGISPVFGHAYPEWKVDTKLAAGARTAIRVGEASPSWQEQVWDSFER
jgi:hypothetical protein